jgi:uncharacterized protein Yka (UPF0111/DUF47 family)
MQTNKITVYTALDGKKYYGVESKGEAQDHDDELSRDLKLAKFDSNVGVLLLDDYPVFSGKYGDVEAYWEEINETDLIGDKWNTFIGELEEIAICPGDLEDFTELSNMLSDVVYLLGGMENIQKILDIVKKHHKSK